MTAIDVLRLLGVDVFMPVGRGDGVFVNSRDGFGNGYGFDNGSGSGDGDGYDYNNYNKYDIGYGNNKYGKYGGKTYTARLIRNNR